MTRMIALALAIALGTAASASDDDILADTATAQKITTHLTEQGYAVRKIELDDGLYEAYAMKDGQRYEVYLDSALNIVKIERDD
ncbi:MAG: PepSY domain-containing protein [Rhodobacteraceae bacterium]|nr:PepSY domain-containing protein [Paracoccaceae bacterium]